MSVSYSFSSVLGPAIISYLALKKALGRRFATETVIMADLDRFERKNSKGVRTAKKVT